MRNPLDRIASYGLTTSQLHILEDALTHPARKHMSDVERYADIARENEMRATLMLVSNDLHGALNAAEIAVAAHAMTDGRRRSDEWVEKRLREIREAELNDPNGMLITKPGARRAVRVKPGDPRHPRTLPSVSEHPR